MNILVINCGSSSLKYQLINSDTEAVLAKGLCERIGIEGSQITYQPAGGEKEVTVSPMPTHTQAIQMVLDALTNKKSGVIASLAEVGAVGHRVVHGGEKFTSSTVITDEAMKAGAHAGNLIKSIAGLVGGGGGGRPNMAQAGGKNPAGIPDAIAAVAEALAAQLS